MYYVYILKCEGNKLYTGITTDIPRRFGEHIQQNGKGARFTRSHKAESIEAVWQTANRSLASKLEYRIKTLTKEKKLALISDDRMLSVLFGEETAKHYLRQAYDAAELNTFRL